MKYSDKIKNLNIQNDEVILQLEDGIEVFHYDGDYIDEALKKTKFLEELSRVMAYEDIRYEFSDAWYYDEEEAVPTHEQIQDQILSNIKEDVWDFIDERLETWSSKKGFCNLSAKIVISPHLLQKAEESGLVLDERWKVKVETLDGELTLNNEGAVS